MFRPLELSAMSQLLLSHKLAAFAVCQRTFPRASYHPNRSHHHQQLNICRLRTFCQTSCSAVPKSRSSIDLNTSKPKPSGQISSTHEVANPQSHNSSTYSQFLSAVDENIPAEKSAHNQNSKAFESHCKQLIGLKQYDQLLQILSKNLNLVQPILERQALFRMIRYILVHNRQPVIALKIFKLFDSFFAQSKSVRRRLEAAALKLSLFIHVEDERQFWNHWPIFLRLYREADLQDDEVMLFSLTTMIKNSKFKLAQRSFANFIESDAAVDALGLLETYLNLLVSSQAQLSYLESAFYLFKKHNLKVTKAAIYTMLKAYRQIGTKDQWNNLLGEYKSHFKDYEIKIFETVNIVRDLKYQEDLFFSLKNEKSSLKEVLKSQTLTIYKNIQDIILSIGEDKSISEETKREIQLKFFINLLWNFAVKKYYSDILRTIKIAQALKLKIDNHKMFNFAIGVYFLKTEQFKSFLMFTQSYLGGNKDANISRDHLALLIGAFKITYPELGHQLVDTLADLHNFTYTKSLGDYLHLKRLPAYYFKTYDNDLDDIVPVTVSSTIDASKILGVIRADLQVGRRPSFQKFVFALKVLAVEQSKKKSQNYKDRNDSYDKSIQRVIKIMEKLNYKVPHSFKFFYLRKEIYDYLMHCEKDLGLLTIGNEETFYNFKPLVQDETLKEAGNNDDGHQFDLFEYFEKQSVADSHNKKQKSNHFIYNFKGCRLVYHSMKSRNRIEHAIEHKIYRFLTENSRDMTFQTYAKVGELASMLKLTGLSKFILLVCEKVIHENSNHDKVLYGNKKEDKDINIIISNKSMQLTYLTLLANYKLEQDYKSYLVILDRILNNTEFKMTKYVIVESKQQLCQFLKLKLRLLNKELRSMNPALCLFVDADDSTDAVVTGSGSGDNSVSGELISLNFNPAPTEDILDLTNLVRRLDLLVASTNNLTANSNKSSNSNNTNVQYGEQQQQQGKLTPEYKDKIIKDFQEFKEFATTAMEYHLQFRMRYQDEYNYIVQDTQQLKLMIRERYSTKKHERNLTRG